MQHFLFVPQESSARERIKDYTAEFADEDLRRATYELEEVFLGKRRQLCKQVAWMGRGCYLKPLGSHYLVVKGVGPGPGSEHMRQMLDGVMRERGHGRGGCLRLDTKTFFPLLVQFINRNNSWVIFDPRPEGFSIFGFLYREAEAALILHQLDVRAVFPLLLLRHKINSPWVPKDPASLEEYLTRRLLPAIQKHLRLSDDDVSLPISFASLVYVDMDGGILIRKSLSPYRIANLHTTAVEGDQEGLRFLTTHMLDILGLGELTCESVTELRLTFASELARTAARLFAEGVIHGQLNIHHQNITLAAELADFDELIFVRAEPALLENIPFPESPYAHRYVEFGRELQRAERELGTDITGVLFDDYQEFVGISYEGLDQPRLAAFMLRQVYDLFVQSLITADLVSRNVTRDAGRTGTVLRPQEIGAVQERFVTVFLDCVVAHKAVPLLDWCMENGFSYLFERLLNLKLKRTLYGWTHADVPLNRLIDICGSERAECIREEAHSFFEVLNSAKSHSAPRTQLENLLDVIHRRE